MPFPWVPLAAGAFSLGQEIFNRSRAGYETSPQKRAWKDSVRNENQIFLRDSAYNSPEAQMKRYKDAGLNPNLIYGQGTPGNITGTAVQANGNVQRADVLGSVMEKLMFNKEMELKDATIDQIKANTQLIQERTGSEDWKQTRQSQDFDYLNENYPEVLRKIKRENEIGDTTKESQIQSSQAGAILLSHKIQTELYKQGLMNQDGSIKTEVLKGKELQNALMQLQKDFVADGDFNASHFWQAVLMLISKGL